MNFRTLTHEELLVFAEEIHGESKPFRSFSLALGAQAEITRRIRNNLVHSDDELNTQVENAADSAWEHGYYEGQRDERQEIKDFIVDQLVFRFKDKIEANAIDEVIGRISRQFPDLPPKREE